MGLLGPIPGVAIGAALLAAGFAWGVVRGAVRDDRWTLIVAVTFLAIAFFILPTRVHERYIFPAVALMPLLAVVSGRWAVALLLLSVGAFINLHAILTLPLYGTANVETLPLGEWFRTQPLVTLSALLQTGVGLWVAWQLRPGLRTSPDAFEARVARARSHRPGARAVIRAHQAAPGPPAAYPAAPAAPCHPGPAEPARPPRGPALVGLAAARSQRAPALRARRAHRPTRSAGAGRAGGAHAHLAWLPPGPAGAHVLRRGLSRAHSRGVPAAVGVRRAARHLRVHPPPPGQVRHGLGHPHRRWQRGHGYGRPGHARRGRRHRGALGPR